MGKCKGCGEPATGYKWCDECALHQKKLHDVLTQRKRRLANLKLCAECKEEFTNTKYCKSCAQTIRKPKEIEMKTCKTVGCETSIQGQKTYCTPCVITRKLKRAKIYEAEKRAERGQLAKVAKVIKPINPMYLHRYRKDYEMDAV
ncbi:hypothetical protein J7J63_03875 [Candidatus Bipolaricaulota bacterium]|nr:hypothetical protein [Candidatus Bipolaricaulota bacterium]